MYYGTTTLATNFTEKEMRHWKIRLIKALLFFVPRANPDTEKLYPRVRAWALELSDEGWPQREIGIDSEGVPLFGAPDSRNTGFWTDMGAKQFDRGELGELTGSEFKHLWSQLPGENKHE
jgi:hypothetical protein